MSKLIILVSSLYLIFLSNVVSSNEIDDLTQIINEIIDIDGVAFYNSCNYKNSPRDNDEIFLLVITSKGGELFSIRKGDFYRDSIINYMQDTREYYFDSYGGQWNISYIADVIDYLLEGDFRILNRNDLSIESKINDSPLCTIIHKKFDYE